jgi:hypothetical protein
LKHVEGAETCYFYRRCPRGQRGLKETPSGLI